MHECTPGQIKAQRLKIKANIPCFYFSCCNHSSETHISTHTQTSTNPPVEWVAAAVVVCVQLLLVRGSPGLFPEPVPGPPGLPVPQHRPARAAPRPRLPPWTVSLRQGQSHPRPVGEHPARSASVEGGPGQCFQQFLLQIQKKKHGLLWLFWFFLPGLAYAFDKMNTLNLNTPYDYNSVMQYHR